MLCFFPGGSFLHHLLANSNHGSDSASNVTGIGCPGAASEFCVSCCCHTFIFSFKTLYMKPLEHMLLTCLIHKWPFSKVPCFFCKGDVHFQWDLLHPQSDALQLTKAVGRTWEVAEYHNWFFLTSDPNEITNSQGKEKSSSTVKRSPIWRVLSTHSLDLNAFLPPVWTSTYVSSGKEAAEDGCPPPADNSSATAARPLLVRQAPDCYICLQIPLPVFFFLKPQAAPFDV